MSDKEDPDYSSIREELSGLSKEELVDEVISKIDWTRQIIYQNFLDTEQMREEINKYREAFNSNEFNEMLENYELLRKKERYWRNMFCALFGLLILVLLISFLIK